MAHPVILSGISLRSVGAIAYAAPVVPSSRNTIALESIGRVFGGAVIAVDGIDLKTRLGEFVALLAPYLVWPWQDHFATHVCRLRNPGLRTHSDLRRQEAAGSPHKRAVTPVFLILRVSRNFSPDCLPSSHYEIELEHSLAWTVPRQPSAGRRVPERSRNLCDRGAHHTYLNTTRVRCSRERVKRTDAERAGRAAFCPPGYSPINSSQTNVDLRNLFAFRPRISREKVHVDRKIRRTRSL